MLSGIFRRLRVWLAGDAADDGLSEEMRLHVALRAEKLRAGGRTAEEADLEALRRFGNPLHLRERSRDMWMNPAISELGRDFRIAARTLLRNPGFTATAALTLAIGIGANTAVFSVVNSVLLRPLAYQESERVVSLSLKAPGAKGVTTASGNLLLSASMYCTFADQNRTLESMGGWSPGAATVTGFAEPERVRTVALTHGVLGALRVRPQRGRAFTSSDDDPHGAQTVVLSHGYWQRRFGGDPAAVGKSLVMEGTPREIVGVMPDGFRVADVDADIYFPFRFDRSKEKLPGFFLQGIGRLKPGVDIAAANADISRLLPVWMTSWPMVPGVDPKIYEKWRMYADLRPLKEHVVGNVGDVLWIVMAAIGLVMLIATANVASLLLVRVEARRQELATRSALGAGAVRIFREILIESILLGLAGGVIGLPLAVGAVRALVAQGPPMLPRLAEVSTDFGAALFTLVFALGGGIIAGAIPGWRHLRRPAAEAMRSASRTSSGSRERGWSRNVLVMAQVGMSVVLLTGAGLMVRTFIAMRNAQPGFAHPAQIQTARIALPGKRDEVLRAHRELLDQLRQAPGVESAAFAREVPMDGFLRNWNAVCQEGKGLFGGEIPPIRTFQTVSPGYFQTMGTRLVAGRELNWVDVEKRVPVVLISENLARELYGSAQAAIGKRLGSCIPNTVLREVTGVVENVPDNGIDKPAPSIVYWPPVVAGLYTAEDFDVARYLTITVRSKSAGTDGMLSALNKALWQVNKGIAVASPRTMQAILDRSMARTSFTMVTLGIAGAMSLLLGVVGIYGVISYAVTQRKREVGIRLALGEQPRTIQTRFVLQSLALAAAGIVVGLVVSALSMRLLQGLLYGTRPLDPVTFLAVPLLLCVAAALASFQPARRAAAVDPVEALRAEG